MSLFGFKPEKYRSDFQLLADSKYVYLDNACMTLKPKHVIEKINEYYTKYPACGGRSSHSLGEQVDAALARSRDQVRKFINASRSEEIIFTRNTTESINLVAHGLALRKGDAVIISDKEHNSNLLPWLQLVKEKGIKLLTCSTTENGLNIEEFNGLLSKNVKLVSIVHTSNVDGTTNPVKEIIDKAHKKNVKVLIDAAQSAPHQPIDVRALDVDFLAFSGHKLLGPTGTGVLYGKYTCLEVLAPLIIGGGTVTNTTQTSYELDDLPMRLEAGLQDYAGLIALGEACAYLMRIGLSTIEKHEQKLNALATSLLDKISKVTIIGPHDSTKRGGIISFSIKGMDSLNVARLLSSQKILVRGGMHCAHAWFNKHKLSGSVRASFYFYNTEEDVHRFVQAVESIARL